MSDFDRGPKTGGISVENPVVRAEQLLNKPSTGKVAQGQAFEPTADIGILRESPHSYEAGEFLKALGLKNTQFPGRIEPNANYPTELTERIRLQLQNRQVEHGEAAGAFRDQLLLLPGVGCKIVAA